MPPLLEQQQQQFQARFDGWLQSYIQLREGDSDCAPVLLKSQSYSLLSGGKRFRPFLAAQVFALFSSESERVRSLCLALEMIHTYSLIHDDLPCMDNDDIRRGQPTNHKTFSEDIALLAGDGLLTDAFFLLASADEIDAGTRAELIRIVSEKTGSAGMVSGQVFDMQATAGISLEELQKIHRLKTGNLIQAAALGAALIAEAADKDMAQIAEFSRHLGMAFQIKDDLLDGADNAQDFKSYLTLLGPEKTSAVLQEHSAHAVAALDRLSGERPVQLLKELVQFNLHRKS